MNRYKEIQENMDINYHIKAIEDKIGVKLSTVKKELYEKNAGVIKFLRRNPIIACEQLLGIKLLDSQKYMLQMAWNTPYVVFNCSRNFGKSFLLAIIGMLNILLYPNQEVFIVSSIGKQAMDTFMKMEKIAKNNVESIPTLKDIFVGEVVKNQNSDGFSHDKGGFKVTTYNGSSVHTLNSVPDNVRGKRANLLLIDEACFCSESLIEVVLPFLTQNTNFKIGVSDNLEDETITDSRMLKKEIPNRVIYSSSAGDMDTSHYRAYRDFAMKMIAGDSRYFVADIPCNIPLNPVLDGRRTEPLLTQQEVDDMMRSNPDKAMREYYNKFQSDGGEEQIVKWASIRRNENFTLPQLSNNGGDKFALALDPARINDNSIISAMKILYDESIGYYGEIVNCTNLIDLGKRRKAPMKMPDQIKTIKEMILDYNGETADYENIEAILLDAGAGGGAITGIADSFLEDWKDSQGRTHKGIIDGTYELYQEELKNYPNASKILKIVNPKAYKTQMVNELVELINLDLIKFPREYNGKTEIPIELLDKEGEAVDVKYRQLSVEEQVALANIDIMKSEVTSIHRYTNAEKTSVRYALSKEKENRIHDDRFYTLILLAHHLYEKRRNDQLAKGRQKPKGFNVDSLFSTFKKPSSYK